MRIEIPGKLEQIIGILENHGFEAYLVGGCVRDSLLGKAPMDWDACTSAKPERVIATLEDNGYRVVPTGLQHGTVTVIVQGESYEITTFRVDGDYEDHRRPTQVVYTTDIVQDLGRRDFTMNAMAYNHQRGLIDPYGGRIDLHHKIIKCVGSPGTRFQEDALRMLRAIRFCAQLNFALEKETSEEILKNGKLLEKISQERIRDELNKILLTSTPSKGICHLIEKGLMTYIIPELLVCIGFEQHNPHHDKDVFRHILEVLDHTERDLYLRLAALLHDIGKPQTFTLDEKGVGHFYGHQLKGMEMTSHILKRLKYDNKAIDIVQMLVREHMSRLQHVKPKAVKRLIQRVGIENIDRFFKLQLADKRGADCDDRQIVRVWEEAKKIIREKQPLFVKDLAIDGTDLIAIGIPQGKRIGGVLNTLLEKVLEEPDLNHREILLRMVEQDFTRGRRRE
ncbi:CCA tRNA nucleotidyltransferase [Anaerosolibacter sp.]|uniref:CCA tRNA nucleotidyltransferase n=1 Tax=Anaerosolibacter sp. TaxID=1872527 RepID=UPI0039F05F89